MAFYEERIEEILRQLKKLCCRENRPIRNWKIWKEEHITNENDLYTPEVVWYETTVVLPEVSEGQRVEFYLDTGIKGEWEQENPQFEFYVNGVLCQGIDRNHRNVLLDKKEWKGQEVRISLRGYLEPLEIEKEFRPYLSIMETEVEQYYFDVYVPFEILMILEKDETNYHILLNCVNDSVNLLDMRKPFSKEFFASLREASASIHKELYEKCTGNYTEEVFCVGQTHIDIAWLWTLGITRRKAVRSFSTVLQLMEQYPEYIFMCSQPQLYAYVKEEAPKLYDRIKERVEEGRWEVEGGMYVEADCNLTGGEALVRQLLVGTQFFKKEFNKDNEILWLPDVFGYSAALPQILKECNIRYFMTTKISWNDTNKMPYDTFYWKGIDGTKILTHFVTTRDYSSATRKRVTTTEYTTAFTTNYNGDIVPSQIKGGWQRYQQKNLNRQTLDSFGFGDGGGGPTKEMLEIQRRLEKAIPGCPKTKMSTAREFFHTLEHELVRKTPIWSGELYLEFHRATYTSMAKNKKLNRYCEFMLQNLEMLGVYAGEYPKDTLDKAWEIVLRNQFHDILPGSAIEEVYKDSWKEYSYVIQNIQVEMKKACEKISDYYQMSKGNVMVYNFNGVEGKGLTVMNKDDWEKADEGIKALPHQQGMEQKVLIPVAQIPAKGFGELSKVVIDMPTSQMHEFSTTHVENDYYRIYLNEKGQFESFYDKRTKREILQVGMCGNVLMTYEDKPFQCDNWNVEHYYTEKSWEVDNLIEAVVVEEGPLRYSLRLTYQYLDSKIIETLHFYPNHSRIDMDFKVHWHEEQIFLKLLFALELNTNEATFDIQYGNVTRNTSRNTSWDCARFEVCYHKWMDLSESGYGVSFLNNCKYGVSVEENVVGLSILKCGNYPNPNADRGEHEFSFAIYPHIGGWREADTVGEAYRFNNPLYAVVCTDEHTDKMMKKYEALISPEKSNVVIEAMKQMEGGKDIIVRMYECYNSNGVIKCILHPDIAAVEVCNMLEETKEQLTIREHSVEIHMKPYEIKTLKLIRK